jgi:hypothetical protein
MGRDFGRNFGLLERDVGCIADEPGKSKLQCTVPSANGPVRLSIFGRAFKYQAEIKLDDDTVVATISRECFGTKEGAIKNRQTVGFQKSCSADCQYYVTVAPGVDLSLMVVLCLAFDDLKRAESRRHSA